MRGDGLFEELSRSMPSQQIQVHPRDTRIRKHRQRRSNSWQGSRMVEGTRTKRQNQVRNLRWRFLYFQFQVLGIEKSISWVGSTHESLQSRCNGGWIITFKVFIAILRWTPFLFLVRISFCAAPRAFQASIFHRVWRHTRISPFPRGSYIRSNFSPPSHSRCLPPALARLCQLVALGGFTAPKTTISCFWLATCNSQRFLSARP